MNRNILITGGTGLIAKEVISGLLKDKHKVVFTSRSQENIDNLVETQFKNQNVHGVVLDLLTKTNLEGWVKQLPLVIDTVIHNARSLESLKNDEFGNASYENVQNEFCMAVTMPYMLTNELLKYNHNLKDVIFISSMYGVVAPTPFLYDDLLHKSPIQYGVAKAAQIHLAKELAVRLCKRKIRVNSISYGGVEGRANKKFVEKYSKLNPMGRMLNAADLYPPIQYVVNNPDLAITGENIKVDGGWTIW